MTNTQDISILLWRVGNVIERWYSVVARKFEYMGRVLNYVDVDVAALKRIHTSTSIYRILVLIDLNDFVKLVWAILVPTKIVKIEPIRLAALACDNTPGMV